MRLLTRRVRGLQVATVPYDPRFPSNNQARNCYTRYNEYYKCIQTKDPDSADCKFYAKAYRSLCPAEWVRPNSLGQALCTASTALTLTNPRCPRVPKRRYCLNAVSL